MKHEPSLAAPDPLRPSGSTGVEWVIGPDGKRGRTLNVTRGCDKISPGCKHCYAERFAERFRGVKGHPYEHGFDLRLVPEALSIPIRRRAPTTWFVDSMSDLFHRDIPDEYIAALMGVIAATPRHTYQVLTKRAERLPLWFEWLEAYRQAANPTDPAGWSFRQILRAELLKHGIDTPQEWGPWPLPNLWLGVSVEDRRYGLPRIEHLRRTPAALRFLSIEPLLEDLGEIDLTGIGWVIVGGESGPGARPMHPDWVRKIRDQCVERYIQFFFKQWGEWAPIGNRDAVRGDSWIAPNGHIIEWKAECIEDAGFEIYRAGRRHVRRVGKKAAGHLLDGVEWRQMPRRS